jgi:tetratricopeptide (TPR) repeat protein
MSTKLSKYCEGIMEAAWLAALIVVPVFFDAYSSRIFEPDKLALLRSLALVILAAWLVKILEEGGICWERLEPGKSKIKTILRVPLVAPVLALVVVYLIATIFSVVPRTSLLGSYQRMQGTYTTLSYLVIFAALAGNLRKRIQVERIITTIIVASLAVSLYGVLQHYQIDPVPWAGNVITRIIASMGNSIFVAAYLIMAIPLVILRLVDSFRCILKDSSGQASNFARATAYVFILALQLIALYFSGSRGPWLGWAASVVFIGLALSLIWRLRWLTLTGVGIFLLGVVFLLVLNIPNGPLKSLQAIPGVGRLGQLLDAESRTGRVRTLIWQGAAELVLPHQPLEYPDGSKDSLNVIRPLIGYGPESMYVAYNPFYQPGLTQVESRNASPDRSHNETWDSLVTTGALGLIVYIALFGSVFYYGLKWLGQINSPRQRNLFFGLYLGGGVVSAILIVALKGVAFFGVGLSFGIIVGLLIYLILAALLGYSVRIQTEGERLRALALVGLMAAIVAHFVEINFGIAIAVTRTYFWTYAALLLLVGYILPLHDEFIEVVPQENLEEKKRLVEATRVKKKRQTTKSALRQPRKRLPVWLRGSLITGLLLGIILITLGYDFMSSSHASQTALSVLMTSLVTTTTASGISYGLLVMILTIWLVGAVVLVSESEEARTSKKWIRSYLAVIGVSGLVSLLYWLWHAGGLAALAQARANSIEAVLALVGNYEGLLTYFYISLFSLVAGLAVVLPVEWPEQAFSTSLRGAITAPILLIVVLFLVAFTNLRPIQADIAFKMAGQFATGNTWPVAIEIYKQANDLAPSEDYYYLFLGRAYIEEAKMMQDATERENLMVQAASDLRKAQLLTPLNTDHTANLARLYNLWATFTTDASLRAQRAQKSSDYFSEAVTLSPHNARLWDEWAYLLMNVMNQPDQAYQRLTHALQIDPYYDWTYALLADYTMETIQSSADISESQKQQALQKAADGYTQALKLVDTSDKQSKYNYAISLGAVETQLGQPDQAIAAYSLALQQFSDNPDGWKIEEKIANLYAGEGDTVNAILHAQNAINTAPQDQKSRLQSLIKQWNG